MVYIVTGSINSGKTTKLLSLYQEIKTGDGFILPKTYMGRNYSGQQIVRLSTGEGRSFSCKDGYIPINWNEKYRYDVYSYSQEGLDFAFQITHDILSNNISPVFIDEIGPLELQEKGFHKICSKLLLENRTIYISVRQTHLKDVIDKYKIINFDLIQSR